METHKTNAISLIELYLETLEDTKKSDADKQKALEGMHSTVKTLGRNRDYGDFMEELGKNNNVYTDAIPNSIVLAKDLLRRLKL